MHESNVFVTSNIKIFAICQTWDMLCTIHLHSSIVSYITVHLHSSFLSYIECFQVSWCTYSYIYWRSWRRSRKDSQQNRKDIQLKITAQYRIHLFAWTKMGRSLHVSLFHAFGTKLGVRLSRYRGVKQSYTRWCNKLFILYVHTIL